MTTTTSTILYADNDVNKPPLRKCFVQSGSGDKLLPAVGDRKPIFYRHRKTAQLPSLISFHPNTPEIKGIKSLHYLKSDWHYQTIPIIILATSVIKDEMGFCAAKGPHHYFFEPCHKSGHVPTVNACISYVAPF